MRILLDENLPEQLVGRLRDLGHEADSVNSLRLKGLENGRLLREVAVSYDLFFTKDAAFAKTAERANPLGHVRLLHVTLVQKRASEFVADFLQAFNDSDWDKYSTGSDWP